MMLLEYDSWYAVFASTTLWATAYTFLRRLALRSKTAEYCCRLIALLHGTVIAFVGINQCFLIDLPFDHPEWRSTELQKRLLVTSLGFFIHDLAWCLAHQSETKLMIAHHCYSVLALTRMLQKSYSGAQTVCALGAMELTNPVLQMRWFLRTEGFYPSKWYSSLEVTFVLVFFLARLLLGTYILVNVLKQPKNDWDFIVFSITIYVMSWMFMVNMCRYFVKKYWQISPRSDEITHQNNRTD